ncbi:Zinc finger CCCH domain-containing protein 16 [Nymphaea thermarum]|nr:Zinc finger CCCH domain-containing protein 16 [Nymphaea thermarum]
MYRKQEVCRNFQRGRFPFFSVLLLFVFLFDVPSDNGSLCLLLVFRYMDVLFLASPLRISEYGARCKFLHTAPQQTETNPYGFGTKAASQAEANPYGFGAKAAPQAKGPVGFGAKNQNQKPFENKWNRFSPLNSSSTTPSRQSESQQAATHTCTNPETCKYQIVEDYKSEQPLWKLTCYGHWNLPCDITGDISYEELRAAAYDDSRKGLPLQLIVERERNLLKNKIAEFDSFLQKPYGHLELKVQIRHLEVQALLLLPHSL